MSRSTTTAGPAGPPVASDAELVAAIRAGRTETWGEVYDRHLARVYAVCFAVLRNRADAEDAAQTTFLKAVERIDQLRDPDALGAWLSGIARRAALDRTRSSRETPVDEWPVTGPAEEPDPTSGLRRREAVALVVDALDGLEARDRLALVLADVEGCDGDALAESLGVRRDHAYVLVRRARERFGRSVSAIVMSRTGRRDCPELARLVGPGDGPLDPRLRKSVARHVEGCERCRETKARRVSPAALLSLLPPVIAPAALRAEPAAALTGGGSTGPSRPGAAPRRVAFRRFGLGPRLLIGVSTAAVVAAAAGTAFVLTRDGSSPSASPTAATTATDDTAPDTTAPPTSSPATPAAGFCGVARDWQDGYTPGPVSRSPADVEEWFTRNLSYVERLADSAPVEVAPGWEQYRAAYAVLVDDLRRAGWDITVAGDAGDDPALAVLADEITADLESRCGIVPPA